MECSKLVRKFDKRLIELQDNSKWNNTNKHDISNFPNPRLVFLVHLFLNNFNHLIENNTRWIQFHIVWDGSAHAGIEMFMTCDKTFLIFTFFDKLNEKESFELVRKLRVQCSKCGIDETSKHFSEDILRSYLEKHLFHF